MWWVGRILDVGTYTRAQQLKLCPSLDYRKLEDARWKSSGFTQAPCGGAIGGVGLILTLFINRL